MGATAGSGLVFSQIENVAWPTGAYNRLWVIEADGWAGDPLGAHQFMPFQRH